MRCRVDLVHLQGHNENKADGYQPPLDWKKNPTIIDLFHSSTHNTYNGFVHLNVPLSYSSEPKCSRSLAIPHRNVNYTCALPAVT